MLNKNLNLLIQNYAETKPKSFFNYFSYFNFHVPRFLFH